GGLRPCLAVPSPIASRTNAASPGRRPSAARPRPSIRRTSSASKPTPALNENRRPLTRPSPMARSTPPAASLAAATGSRPSPSARGSTLVPPPGRKPSGTGRVTPFSTSLYVPPPPRAEIDSAHASRPLARQDVDRPAGRLALSGESRRVARCARTEHLDARRKGREHPLDDLLGDVARARVDDQDGAHGDSLRRARCVAPDAVEEGREEPVCERVRVRAGSDPGVRPVRCREHEQDCGLDV